MKPSMKAKLEQLDARLAELNSLLVQEEITKDMDQYRKLNREHAEISPVVEQFQLYLQAEADEEAALAMQSDPEMKDFAEEEIKSARTRMEQMQADLQRHTIPYYHTHHPQERHPHIIYRDWETDRKSVV